MNTVTYLIHKEGHCGYEELVKIKNMGADRPMLQITQTTVLANGRQMNYYFSLDYYKKIPWLCGCPERKLLFCFPCLLFRGDKVWTKIGTADLKHLLDKARVHENSKSHIQNATDLALLGKANIVTQLDTAFQVEVREHNKKVEKNRYLISRLVDCIKFCGMFELALRTNNPKISDNRSIFLGLVDFVAELDTILKDYLNSTTVFKEKSKTVQNELLECILEVCREHIKQELKNAKYVSIMSEDTADSSTKTQLVIVYRFISPNGHIVERFWGYCNPTSTKPVNMAESIIAQLDQHFEPVPDKLVSQSYDATTSLTIEPKERLQYFIKQRYPNAHCIHSYAQNLNLMIQQATSKIPQIRLFFANLSSFGTFFNRSTVCTNALNAVVYKRIPQALPRYWDFEGKAVLTVYSYREELAECLESVIASGDVDKPTLNDAVGLLNHLESNTFMFWLSHFFNILPHVEILAKQMEQRNVDSHAIKQYLSNFEEEIIKIKAEIEAMEVESEPDMANLQRNYISATYKIQIAKQICDVVIIQIRERFSYINHFIMTKLFHSEHYEGYIKTYPKKEILAALHSYPFLDKLRLKTELSILYSRNDFQSATGILPLLHFFVQNNLQSTYCETTKLLTVLATIPMMTLETDRCLNTLERIKTFIRSSITEDQLNALTMLAIEKDLIIKQIPEFNKQVIEKFSDMKNRRRDFTYK